MPGEFAGAARLSAAVARVLSTDGVAVGAGFVIGSTHIATCAHVVAAAVEDADDMSDAVVTVEFPLVPGIPRVTARVRRWEPVRLDGRGDIALLELEDEILGGIAAPPLWRADRPWGREFRLIGFPAELPDGVWTSGEFRESQGSGWLQLQGAVGSQPITGGFSGSAVWDVGSEAVVGMAVAADRRRFTRTAFMIPVNEVIGLDPGLLPNPYRGLEPFSENDSALFYGRDDDIDRVLRALRERPLAAVAGPSGTGKSSLMLAGVVPRLRADGWRIEYQTADTLWSNPRVPPGEKVLLVADQFEELLATDPQLARERLRGWVERAADPAVRVLLTLRWGALDDLVDDDLVHALDGALLALAPMNRDQLRQAIRGPVSHAPGVDIDEDLVERLVDDTVDEPGGLPLLESVLTELWDRRSGGRVSLADYEEVGRAAGSIARRAEQVFAEFDSAGAASAQRLLTMLAAPRGEGFVRVQVAMRDFPELRTAAGRLARERLVVTGRDTDDTDIVELAHQALIENWPRLREWLDHDRAFLEWEQQADAARRAWHARGEDDGALLRGSALQASEDWIAKRPGDIPVPLRGYIAAGTRKRRREVRRWRAVTAVLAVLVLVAGTTAVVAYRTSALRAEMLRHQAGITLAEESLRLATSQPNTALQFAQAAARLAPGEHQVESALLTQQLRMGSATSIRTGLWRDVRLVAADDSASVIVVAESDGAVTVWPGLLDGRTDPWRLPVTNVVSLALSGNGHRLATVSSTGGVRLWDVRDRTGPFPIRPEGSGAVAATAIQAKFSFNGARLVLSYDARRSLLSFDDPRRRASDVGDPDVVETYDTRTSTPTREDAFTTTGRADLVPLRVDSQRPEVWFAEYDSQGGRETVLRATSGRDLDPTQADLDARNAAVSPCDPDQPAMLAIREPVGMRAFGAGTGCLKSPGSYFRADLDRTGRYTVIETAVEDSIFQVLDIVEPISGEQYLMQTRYQNTGGRAYIVRPGSSGPELFVIGADDLTHYSAGQHSADLSRQTSFREYQTEMAAMDWSADLQYVGVFQAAEEPHTLSLHRIRPQADVIASLPVDWSAEGVSLAFTRDGRFLVAGRNTHELLVYSVPDLRFVTRIGLPAPPAYTDPATTPSPITLVPIRDDVIAVLHAGYVTRWHIGDGSADGGAQQVWQHPENLAEVADWGLAADNGSNPDELVLFVRDRIVVWDSVKGQAIRTLSSSGTDQAEKAYKPDRIPIVYVWTTQQRVERWETDTGRVGPAPVAIPAADMHTLAANGLFIDAWQVGPFQVLDTELGSLVTGTLLFPTLGARAAFDGNTMVFLSALGPLRLDLERTGIPERLCAISDRDFTAAELKLLPPGADSGRPCH
ncbi:trypsin-like peptidase domain-containing protein [Nocardia sp. NPDC051030]|uniref:nSTAND1 domain-containing NTPase n=1 Tax=Nocardia sp. NPDC051030 TaxID=3155162 RepID=UPI00343009D3